MQQQSQYSRLDYIDALRGLAALMVLIFHTVLRSAKVLPAWAEALNAQGARGVQLFYVVSAFTIFLTLEIRKKREDACMRNFFIRRFFRIAPLFYSAVLFYLWLYGRGPRWALGSDSYVTGSNIAANVLFINGFNPYWINSVVPVGWSVAVEMTFYCCIPLLFLWITNLGRALWFALGSLILSLFLQHWLHANPFIADRRLWNEFLFLWFFNQLPVFALGIALFFIIQKYSSPQSPPRTSLGKVLILFSIFLLIALAFKSVPYLPKHFLYGIAFTVLTLGLSFHPSRILVNPFLVYTGKISFSIYLTHVFCIRMANTAVSWYLQVPLEQMPRQSPLLLLPLVLAITLAVAAITYRLIEIPGQEMGRRIIKRTSKPLPG